VSTFSAAFACSTPARNNVARDSGRSGPAVFTSKWPCPRFVDTERGQGQRSRGLTMSKRSLNGQLRSDRGDSCSRSIAPLEYVLMMIEGAVHLCPHCKPESDAVGFAMHAEYAAKMHAHLAEELALNVVVPPPNSSPPTPGQTRVIARMLGQGGIVLS
jgi:hypothetical protein